MHAYAHRGPCTVRFLAFTVGGPIDECFDASHRGVKRMPDDAPALAELAAQFGVTMVGPRG